MSSVTATRAGHEADAIDGVVPGQVIEPESGEAFAGALAEAADGRRRTVIRGAGSKLAWGRPPAAVDLVISTAKLDRLIAHRHGDLTATVQAGLPLAALNASLRAQGQWLPLDSAFPGTTVGGLVATNEAGPSRHRHGTPRDLVIGVTLALTDGRLVKAGGTVVKNVAGYDLGKLVAGSHGTLAGIVDLTFKLVPVPQASATLIAAYSDPDALARDVAALAGSQVEPEAFDVTVAPGLASGSAPEERPYRLHLRIATSPAATEAQIAAARALVHGDTLVMTGDEEAGLWASRLTMAWRGDATVRLSWLPSALPQVTALLTSLHQGGEVSAALVGRALGAGYVRLAGAPAALTRAVARLRESPHVGHVAVLQAPRAVKEAIDVWGPPPSAAAVARALKQKFDPAGILNAGRGPV